MWCDKDVLTVALHEYGHAVAGGVIDVALGNSYLRRKDRVEGTVLLVSGFMSFIPSGAVERKGLGIVAGNALKQIGKETAERLVSKWGKYAEWAALYLKHNGKAVTEEEIEMLVKYRINYLKTMNNSELSAKIDLLEKPLNPSMTPTLRQWLLDGIFESDVKLAKEGVLDNGAIFEQTVADRFVKLGRVVESRDENIITSLGRTDIDIRIRSPEARFVVEVKSNIEMDVQGYLKNNPTWSRETAEEAVASDIMNKFQKMKKAYPDYTPLFVSKINIPEKIKNILIRNNIFIEEG